MGEIIIFNDFSKIKKAHIESISQLRIHGIVWFGLTFRLVVSLCVILFDVI